MRVRDRLLLLLAPDRNRWKPMLLGLALFAGAVGLTAWLEPPALVEGVLLVLALAAWYIGACAMVGYTRWFFASELTRAARDRAAEIEREKKK